MYPRYKVKEARYFFEKIKKLDKNNEEYCFNFSALLSASRSVTFAIQKLYRHKEDFTNEYKKLQDELKLNQFSQEFLEGRNINEKEGHKVPILITTLTNLETKNKLTYHCDPIPAGDDNTVRSVHIQLDEKNEIRYPMGTTENEIISRTNSRLYMITNEFKISKTIHSEYSIKLLIDGDVYTEEKLYENIEQILRLLEKATLDYERLWPTGFESK